MCVCVCNKLPLSFKLYCFSERPLSLFSPSLFQTKGRIYVFSLHVECGGTELQGASATQREGRTGGMKQWQTLNLPNPLKISMCCALVTGNHSFWKCEQWNGHFRDTATDWNWLHGGKSNSQDTLILQDKNRAGLHWSRRLRHSQSSCYNQALMRCKTSSSATR